MKLRPFSLWALAGLMIIALSLFVQSTEAKKASGCVNCHTSETIMKSLVKLPEVTQAAGEG
ncbi:MAG: hypothetical protein U1C55_02220 [Smithellaceae bacterium]|nr:hypothetical protein [Smithellaceae bacterium]